MSNETIARLPYNWSPTENLQFPLKYQERFFWNYEEFHEYIVSHFPKNIMETFNPHF